MQFIFDVLHDLRAALAAGVNEWHRWRLMRAGYCPDELPF